jgi:hypothetical protein
MWVAQITEPAPFEEAEHQFNCLTDLFPCYQFSITQGRDSKYVIIARPHPVTVMFPEDGATQAEMLQFIVTELLNERITGHLVTDDIVLYNPNPVAVDYASDGNGTPGAAP